MPLTWQRVLLNYSNTSLCFLLLMQGYAVSAAPVYNDVNLWVAMERSGSTGLFPCSFALEPAINTTHACQGLRLTRGLYSLDNKPDANGSTVKQWGDAPPAVVGQTTWDNLVCQYNGTGSSPQEHYRTSCYKYVDVNYKAGVSDCLFCGLTVSLAVPASPGSDPNTLSPQSAPAPGPTSQQDELQMAEAAQPAPTHAAAAEELARAGSAIKKAIPGTGG